MDATERERPCIHVCLVGGADESLYRWVEIGAEEEGVPTRQVATQAAEPTAAAFEAAQSSRFDVGVSVAPGRVTLHERHMPAERPVLAFDDGADFRSLCRLMGGNAARMVIRLPFRFEPNPATLASSERLGKPNPSSLPDPAGFGPGDNDIDAATVVKIVVRILRERGIV